MAPSIPKTAAAWTVSVADDFSGLKFNKDTPVPALSDNDVLVRLYAASLNYRDLIIAKVSFAGGCSAPVSFNPSLAVNTKYAPRANIHLASRRM